MRYAIALLLLSAVASQPAIGQSSSSRLAATPSFDPTVKTKPDPRHLPEASVSARLVATASTLSVTNAASSGLAISAGAWMAIRGSGRRHAHMGPRRP